VPPQLYLHTNGKTVVAKDTPVVGSKYTLNGVSYLVVEEGNWHKWYKKMDNNSIKYPKNSNN